MENNFNLKKFLIENKLTENSRHLGENEYSSEEEDRLDQLMVTVIEKIGFNYPVFEDIKEDAINLMDEQEGTSAHEALYAAAETWNEEFQDNGDENGEDIASRMMSILDDLEGSLKEEWSEEKEQQLRQLADQVGFDQLMDKYAPSYVDSLPNIEDYIGDIYDSGGEIGDEFLNPETLKADIIDYARNL